MISDELYDYQRVAVEFIVARSGAALFFEQGTGKTHVAAGAIESLMTRGRLSALCVVPLANLQTTWVKLLSRIDGLVICRTWEEFKRVDGHRLLLLNYEAIRGKLTKKLVGASWDLVLYDESQRLKARGSKASRVAARFKNVGHRVILSGTPVEQCPQDLWAQLRFACPDVLGTRWADFDSTWLRPTGFMGYEREFLWNKLPEFLDLIRPHVMRVTKDEVLDLPPVSFRVEKVELTGDQARVYREIEDGMVAILVDGRVVVCDLAITQLVRLQQVAGGFIRTEEGESVVVGDAKRKRLRRLLCTTPTPAIIFVKYREELAVVVEVAGSLDMTVGVVSGDTRKTRVATVEAFQRGEIEVLVCQIRAGGVGLDLFAASRAIFYSTTFSSIDFEQAVSRLHRNGQTRPVEIVLLQAENTVDTDIHSALLQKRTISQRVLEDRSRRRDMSKEKTKPAATAEKTETKKAPPQPPKPKYGVPELADALGVKASSIRVRLRSAGIPKNGKLYAWDSKAEMMEVVAKLKETGRKVKEAA